MRSPIKTANGHVLTQRVSRIFYNLTLLIQALVWSLENFKNCDMSISLTK